MKTAIWLTSAVFAIAALSLLATVALAEDTMVPLPATISITNSGIVNNIDQTRDYT